MPGPSFYQNFNVKFIRSETELQKEFNLILIIDQFSLLDLKNLDVFTILP